jgi:hypothetical protein
MGISISGPSTQIPTNVVEVGNEITQNQLNAITASTTPSTGNPMQTQTAMVNYLNANVWPTINQKTTNPQFSWSHPFSYNGNFVLVLRPNSNTWWPWNAAGTVIASVSGGTVQNSFNYDFTDWYGNSVYLQGNPDVGTSATNYTTLGYWDDVNQTTYTQSSGTNYYPANGPSYGGNWSDYVSYSNQFYDGMNNMYRYVFLAGGGNFYTADNQNNPPY